MLQLFLITAYLTTYSNKFLIIFNDTTVTREQEFEK